MIIACMTAFAEAAHARQGLSVGARALLYGDNTEFRNPFREGETIFGAAVRLDAGIELSGAVTLSLGVFGNQRFGSGDAFELVRPVIALIVSRPRSRFVFGTLEAPRAGSPAGPDRTGPHGLIPPLQRETLAFDRPYEAGLQWTFTGRSLDHDMWLQWQRLNTPAHRERFDAGLRTAWTMAPRLAIPVELHVVHEGGQLFSSGAVRDSLAVGSGVVLSSDLRRQDRVDRRALTASLELLGLWSRDTPDRQAARPTRHGGAIFGRASLARLGWRAHLIMWRGDDFVKDEGDPNYMAIRRDGTRWRGVRDYAEAGVTRTFPLAPGALVEASFRVHRIERHYEYSYRVVGVVDARARVR